MNGILRHNYRETTNGRYSNKEIHTELSHYNMHLSPDYGTVEGKHYKGAMRHYSARREEVHYVDRKDLVTMVEWVVTLPSDVWDRSKSIKEAGDFFPVGNDLERVEKFFRCVADFMRERYGAENILGMEVHFDELKEIKVQDRDWQGKPAYDKDGRPVWKMDSEGEVVKEYIGQPHIHVDLCPIVEMKEEINGKSEKFSARTRFNRTELRSFHPDLDRYLRERGIPCSIINGSTKDHNFTVDQLKSGLKEEYERLKEFERSRERSWYS